MNPEDLLVHVDGKDKVKIGGYMLPAEDFSLTRFMLQDLGMSWLHPGGIISTIRLLEMLRLKSEMRVLDLGCGIGSTTRYIAKKFNCEVIGIDHNKDMIHQAKDRTHGHRYHGISYHVMDGNNMAFPDCSFDRVIMQSVACFNDKPRIFREAVRVLKNGGVLGLNEVTWIQPPTVTVERVTRSTICETFKGAILEKQWIETLEKSGLAEINHQVFAFETMAPYQMLREEGLMNTARIMSRVLRNPEINIRLSAVSDYFKKYPGYFGYGIYTGCKPVTN